MKNLYRAAFQYTVYRFPASRPPNHYQFDSPACVVWESSILNFQGFLNELQDWEVSMKDKEKHSVGKSGAAESARKKYKSNYGERSHLSSNYTVEETFVDANSEKDLGNDFFKQKKYNEAVDCYSRSIALSPTAVAYANSAMAYLKVERQVKYVKTPVSFCLFREAEADCTEALDLDDRYIKAYSRRATARKELGKPKEALDDVQFALRLEPNNQEIKKQFSIKHLVLLFTTKKVVENKADSHGHAKGIHLIPDGHKKGGVAEIPDTKMAASKGYVEIKEVDEQKKISKITTDSGSEMRKGKVSKQELAASVHELAYRAMTEAAKNISPPTSAYQFEVSWKGFCGDRSLQTQLLKIFKLAVEYLKSLTKVSRFDMLILCLPATEKADLRITWDDVFLSESAPIEYAEILSELRPKYCPGGDRTMMEMFVLGFN
ncbi:LOW QUALITY PROTEIN: hypothetical protein V2J09_007839 [Rumex salicifolius]